MCVGLSVLWIRPSVRSESVSLSVSTVQHSRLVDISCTHSNHHHLPVSISPKRAHPPSARPNPLPPPSTPAFLWAHPRSTLFIPPSPSPRLSSSFFARHPFTQAEPSTARAVILASTTPTSLRPSSTHSHTHFSAQLDTRDPSLTTSHVHLRPFSNHHFCLRPPTPQHVLASFHICIHCVSTRYTTHH